MKKALITGITGQDGSYLAEILLKKNYIVHGIKRRTSLINTKRIDHLYKAPFINDRDFILHHGDLTDSSSLINIIQTIKPDEIYNLAAQSHVAVSFEVPEYTANSDAIGTLRLLEAIKILNLSRKCKFYQASTSELFGNAPTPQNEKTKFSPRSPYAIAKLYAYWITVNYREAYKIFASNGILFNHESPRRGETFVTKKIIEALVKISLKKEDCLYLGSLDSKRDWGHAKDYMFAAWKILQHDKPDDFCIGSEKQYTVRDFVTIVANKLSIDIKWIGQGLKEVGKDQNNRTIIRVNKQYYRPTEVEDLLSDCSKARKELGWKPTYSIEKLIEEMIHEEFKKN